MMKKKVRKSEEEVKVRILNDNKQTVANILFTREKSVSETSKYTQERERKR